MKTFKQFILLFYMLGSFWIVYLIFNYHFNVDINYTADGNILENNFMLLLMSTIYSAFAILFMGVLALFTNFVFVKLLQSTEIKQSAIEYLKRKRELIRDEIEKSKKIISEQESEK